MKHIILLHGLFHYPWMLNWLKFQLSDKADVVDTFGYDSRTYNDDVLIQLYDKIQKIPDNHELLLIGHSMGGLVIRQYLNAYPRSNVRVLTLGTPHQGSQVAEWCYQHPWIAYLLGSSEQAGLTVDYLPPYDGSYPLTSVAGTSQHGMISLFNLDVNYPHDGTVYQTETYLKGAEHVTLDGVPHVGLLCYPSAIEYVHQWIGTPI